MKTERVNLRVERDLAKLLRKMAKDEHSTVSHVARKLLYRLFEWQGKAARGGAAS